MNPQAVVAFNAAMATLREIAKAEGLDTVSVFVRQDGRVHVYGASHTMTKWVAEGDLHRGGALPTPGEALERRSSLKGSPDAR